MVRASACNCILCSTHNTLWPCVPHPSPPPVIWACLSNLRVPSLAPNSVRGTLLSPSRPMGHAQQKNISPLLGLYSDFCCHSPQACACQQFVIAFSSCSCFTNSPPALNFQIGGFMLRNLTLTWLKVNTHHSHSAHIIVHTI